MLRMLAAGVGGIGQGDRLNHTARAQAACGAMFQGRLAQTHVEQFHADVAMHDFVEFPASYFIHSLPPERAPSELTPMRAGRSFSSKIERARFSRDLTVPTGQSNSAAASL